MIEEEAIYVCDSKCCLNFGLETVGPSLNMGLKCFVCKQPLRLQEKNLDAEMDRMIQENERKQEERGFLSDPDFQRPPEDRFPQDPLRDPLPLSTPAALKTKRDKGKKDAVESLRLELSTEEGIAIEALMKVFEQQTLSEQDVREARDKNNVGFTKFDAELLTSFAKQFQSKGYLSPRQKEIVLKRMPKYAKQLLEIAERKRGS